MIQGDIKNMPGIEVLQVLSQGGHEGCFVVENKDAKRRVYISGEGNVLYIESTFPKEKLGFLLTQMSLISESNLEKLRQLETTSGAKTASLLLRKELVTPKDLGACVKYQFQTVLSSILTLKRGKFYFHNGEEPPKNILKIRLSLQSLLLGCVTISDKIQHLMAQLGGEDALYQRINDRRKQITLSPVELDILIAADENVSVRDFLNHMRYPDVDILEALNIMTKNGILSHQGKRLPKSLELVPKATIQKLKTSLVDQIGPIGNFLVTEAIEKLSEDSENVEKADWPLLLDMIVKELDAEDRKTFESNMEELNEQN